MADLSFLTDSQKLRHSLLEILADSNHYYTADEYVQLVKLFEKELFSDEPFNRGGREVGSKQSSAPEIVDTPVLQKRLYAQ